MNSISCFMPKVLCDYRALIHEYAAVEPYASYASLRHLTVRPMWNVKYAMNGYIINTKL